MCENQEQSFAGKKFEKLKVFAVQKRSFTDVKVIYWFLTITQLQIESTQSRTSTCIDIFITSSGNLHS